MKASESQESQLSITPEQVVTCLRPFVKELYFQLEKAESGYIHYQGCLSLKTKKRMSSIKNLIRNDIHLEPARNWHAAKNYAQKQETRIEGPWNLESVFIKLPEKLLPWQENVIKDIETYKNNDRIILWYWDDIGGAGKTVLCKYLISKHGATFIGNAAGKDMAHAIPDNPIIIVMNLTRTNEDHINYGAIEAIKDGLIFSPKYESKCKIFNSPTVIIFANFKPDINKMSKDRWKITFVGKEEPMEEENYSMFL